MAEKPPVVLTITVRRAPDPPGTAHYTASTAVHYIEVGEQFETSADYLKALDHVAAFIAALRDHGDTSPWELPAEQRDRDHSGAGASWCPVCGTCTCERDADTGEICDPFVLYRSLRCPLHGMESRHPGGAELDLDHVDLFSWGYGQERPGRFVRIAGRDHEDCRRRMNDLYGPRWAFQYELEEEPKLLASGMTEWDGAE